MNGLLEIIDKDLIINPLTSAKRDGAFSGSHPFCEVWSLMTR